MRVDFVPGISCLRQASDCQKNTSLQRVPASFIGKQEQVQQKYECICPHDSKMLMASLLALTRRAACGTGLRGAAG